jgi:hypothetical protein
MQPFKFLMRFIPNLLGDSQNLRERLATKSKEFDLYCKPLVDTQIFLKEYFRRTLDSAAKTFHDAPK